MTGAALLSNLLLFGGVLRGCGLAVPPSRLVDAAAALACVGVRDRQDVRAALRCLLVSRQADLALFDEAFDLFWRARGTACNGGLLPLGARPRVVTARAPRAGVTLDHETEDALRHGHARLAFGAWSAAESLRTKDFAEWTPDELARAEALFACLPWRLPLRRTRRWTPARRGPVDMRRALRRSTLAGGDIGALPRRARAVRARPVVVLADVSGSMERYSRVVLQFVHGLSSGPSQVEAFVFATRLTRLTRRSRARTRGEALAAAARAVQDWGGGTRIGDALRAFNLTWARRVMRHGPIVLIVSDGWDRGDPDVLARELARVRRSCTRLIWLNPLLGAAGYEPLTRGMQAARAHIDELRPIRNLESVAALMEALRDCGRVARSA